MEKFKEFSLPIRGLKNGVHEFDFTIDANFFKEFEGSPIENGEFDVHLTMDKRDAFFELVFDFDGTIETECDRCTAPIALPFGDTHYLTVKHSIETQDEDAEIVFISPDTSHFNVAQYVYEFICLSVPFHKVYDCENDDTPPCDFTVLDHIADSAAIEAAEEAAQTSKNPFDDLKNLFGSDN
jgi:uncharacterized protein